MELLEAATGIEPGVPGLQTVRDLDVLCAVVTHRASDLRFCRSPTTQLYAPFAVVTHGAFAFRFTEDRRHSPAAQAPGGPRVAPLRQPASLGLCLERAFR